MKKQKFKPYYNSQPESPPSLLRRWFLEMEDPGFLWILVLFLLGFISYLQFDRLQLGQSQAILHATWGIWLLTAAIAYLAALELTSRIYERTTGRGYRERDEELQIIASQAERRAVVAAKEAFRARTRELEQREVDYAARFQQLRREETELHHQNLALLSKIRDSKVNAKNSCSGTEKRRKKRTYGSTNFKDLGIP